MLNNVNMNEGQPVRQAGQVDRASGAKAAARGSFDAAMRKELDKLHDVKFSAHALSRISSRNIRIGDAERAQIADAVEKARAKGSQDSLVLLERAALVVSIKNRTVVTVLDREEMRGAVFTNIDSAVVTDGA